MDLPSKSGWCDGKDARLDARRPRPFRTTHHLPLLPATSLEADVEPMIVLRRRGIKPVASGAT
jgi:hypothetical protein